MLSRLFQSARNIFNFGKSVLEPDSETPATTSTPTMVTTRRQSGNKHALGTQSSPVVEDVLGVDLSKKRRRVEPADDKSSPRDEPIATPTKKKQKKLPLRNKDEEHFERHSHFEVVIPVKEIVRESKESSISSSKRKSTGKRNPMSKSPREDAGSENEGEDLPEIEHTAEKKMKEAVEGEKVPRFSGKKPDKVGRRKMANVSSKQTQTRDEVSSRAINSSKDVAPKHKRFGSEDLATEEVSDLVPTTEVAPSEDEDEDSDDDAPEVVEKHDAQERARTAARIASKAAEE
jgi:U3 small nucleolar RNA-associated protein 16